MSQERTPGDPKNSSLPDDLGATLESDMSINFVSTSSNGTNSGIYPKKLFKISNHEYSFSGKGFF